MAATPSLSSSICNRIYNLSFTHSSLSLTTTNFPQRPISHKPFNLFLNSQSFNLSPLSLHPPFAAALDEIEASQDNTSSQQHDSESEPETETEPGRLFVGNLPFSMTSYQLAEIFAEAGTVVSVEIVYDRLTDRSRGFAFVTMGSIEDANEAIRMFDGSHVGGRSVKVNFREVPKGGERLVMGASQDNTSSQQHDSESEPETETETFEKPQEENEEQNVTNSNDSGRLFVGNLPFSMTSSQLAEIFAEAGTVVSVEIVYDRLTDRSRGFAFVTMGSIEDANEAIRMFDGSQVGGRSVKVNFPEVPKGGERLVMGAKIRNNYKGFVDSPHKIYAGNLGWGLTSQDLRDAFAEQPGLLSAKVIYERDSGRSRGFGFVTFQTAEDVDAALKVMNGVEVEGRPLRLKLAAERTSSSTPVIVENTENNVDSSEMVSRAAGT